MNTEFYRQLVAIQRKNETSRRGLAKMCGLCYGTFIEFFNPDKPFRPLREQTMAKIHNSLGISYEVMEDYNRIVKEERKLQKERGE